MSNAAEHRATALKWLKSTETMNELFRLETEIVRMIARYNLAKSNLSEDIGEIAIGLHSLVDKFERLLDEGKSGHIVSAPGPVESAIGSETAGGILKCNLVKAASQSSTSNDDSDKPSDWDSLTIPQRIAYRKSAASADDKNTTVKREPDNLSAIRAETEVMRSQIINPPLAEVDDKFDLTNRDFNEKF